MRMISATARVIAVAAGMLLASAGAQSPVLTPVMTVRLPNVGGRIDHLAYDAARQHLFVAALGNDTIEVVDTAKGEHLRSLRGFSEPQGLALVADATAVAIANGGNGTLQIVDAATFANRTTTRAGGDADNVRYEVAANRVYVAAEGGITVVNPGSGRILQHIAIDGHPESFQLESSGTRLYGNVPGASQIVVADRATATVLQRWATGSCQANYPMALDEPTHRLFVGCRQPAAVATFDTLTGKQLGSQPTVGDTDDLFYDAVRNRLYAVGGEGFIDVLRRDGDRLTSIARTATRSGARTALWVAEQSRLYVAAPARGAEPAAILVFEAQAR